MLHTLAALAVSLLPVLGPEVPLTHDFPNEPIGGDAVALAANGSDFLLVWQDSRSGSPAIRATRVDSTGHAANPGGYLIGQGTKPQVARAGSGYLIVWQNALQLWSAHVDANGSLAGSPSVLISFGQNPAALLTTGSSFLLVYSQGAALLGPAGNVLMPSIPVGGAFLGAAVHGGSYVVVARTQPDYNAGIFTIGDDGSTSQRQFPLPGLGRAAFGDNSILVVMSVSYIVVGYDGTIIKPSTMQLLPPAREIAAAWDGHEFLATFDRTAFRVAADGTLIDASGFALSANSVRQFTFAPGLAAWTDGLAGAALVGRAVHDFDALAAASAPPVNLALAPKPQIDAQIAFAGAATYGVWSDANRFEARASFNGGTPIAIDAATRAADLVGWPNVAAGKNTFVILWKHKTLGGGDQVLYKRFDLAGHALDPAPMSVDSSPDPSPNYDPTNDAPPAIAFDGSGFFLAWGRGPQPIQTRTTLYTARIDDGGPLREFTQTLTSIFGLVDRPTRVLWTGSDLAVVHAVESFPNVPELPNGGIVLLHRFDLSANTIGDERGAGITFGGVPVPGATVSPDGITYAWAEPYGGSVVVAQSKFDGTPLQLQRTVIAQTNVAGTTNYADIAWDGSHYVLVWLAPVDSSTGARRVQATRLDRNLVPIDSAPFDISSTPGPSSPPRVMPTATGVVIVYSRNDDSGSARAFTRTLDAVPAPPAPDLTLTNGINLTPNTVRVGDVVSVSYQVKNQGDAAAGASTTHIELKRDPDGSIVFAQDFSTEALAAGAAIGEAHAVPVPISVPAGVYTVTVTLDRGAVINESYRANDTATAKLTVIAAAPPCTFSLDPSDLTVPSGGGSGSIKVVASDATCSWSVTSLDPWLTLTSSSGTGNGTIAFTARANPNATPRATTLFLGNAATTIHQPGSNVRRHVVH